MSKRTPKISSEHVRKPPTMTVARDKNPSSFVVPISPARKSPWPSGIDSSWDNNSGATSSSWPEDIEEVATKKVLDLWNAVERILYKEDNEEEALAQGSVAEECIQWRTQIPHFRVVGKKMNIQVVDEDGEICTAELGRDLQSKNEEISDSGKKKPTSSKRSKDLKEKIIDLLVDYIMDEVEKDDIPSDTSKDLDDVLRITPAPTYSGRKTLKSRELSNSSRNRSANRIKSFELTELIPNSKAFKKLPQNAKNSIDDNNEDEDDDVSSVDTNQLGRNKLGTVFNKKIVVSPVPFAVTTRESFCTLRTTPIKYAGHLLELTTPQGFYRNMSSASKINSAKRSTLSKLPQRHSSAWQAPVSRSACPKNVRLAPIDPSRLPSSNKNRSVALPALPQRHKNSLSPISRPFKVTSADNFTVVSLEIQGKQIAQSAKPNLIQNGWGNPRTQRRKKKVENE
ncbi:uncharacterized protein LOC107041447 [Diachasma alloeum]|uniref:uncharacterized protein LOC107041447 n=1 Tax=Diachasma alloeum TaxID=454923 RepID=UPI00073819FE|nr:uncharacterized protein LOC107041447 [Diachasma alloeum]XP_015117511.1 uncharacterized protein LOC107041447 [Diachasma alloeum]XP_015117512.1 uncharacterized protein LOC107041447 [Diachasma alloeum]XP_015117513.1 uncharacterized protein LOC107041447 [Diachasma alloeum]